MYSKSPAVPEKIRFQLYAGRTMLCPRRKAATENSTGMVGTDTGEAPGSTSLRPLVKTSSITEERQILETMAKTSGQPTCSAVVTPAQILKAREVINDIYVDDKVKDYIVDLVCATRDPDHYKIAVKDFIQLGASPHATIALTLAAKAYAFLKGRGYVTPQDVKSIGMDVLRHRVAITYEAEAEEKTSETVIQKIFDELPVP